MRKGQRHGYHAKKATDKDYILPLGKGLMVKKATETNNEARVLVGDLWHGCALVISISSEILEKRWAFRFENASILLDEDLLFSK